MTAKALPGNFTALLQKFFVGNIEGSAVHVSREGCRIGIPFSQPILAFNGSQHRTYPHFEGSNFEPFELSLKSSSDFIQQNYSSGYQVRIGMRQLLDRICVTIREFSKNKAAYKQILFLVEFRIGGKRCMPHPAGRLQMRIIVIVQFVHLPVLVGNLFTFRAHADRIENRLDNSLFFFERPVHVNTPQGADHSYQNQTGAKTKYKKKKGCTGSVSHEEKSFM